MDEGFDEEPLVLALLSDAELLEQMQADLYDGLPEELLEGTLILLNRGWRARRVLREALLPGVAAACCDYADGLLDDGAAWSVVDALRAAADALRPILVDEPGPAGRMALSRSHDVAVALTELPPGLAAEDLDGVASFLAEAGLLLVR